MIIFVESQMEPRSKISLEQLFSLKGSTCFYWLIGIVRVQHECH